MRPGQQNKRSRGRSSGGNNNNNNNNNNFNRKGSNPLTRTYDSSGPDVKIRGTAQHIAEKYMALARDSQSSGDRVMAENYLQHAEHYNRIIAAAQSQLQERVHRDDRDYHDRDGHDLDGDDMDLPSDRSHGGGQPTHGQSHGQSSGQPHAPSHAQPVFLAQPVAVPADVEIAGSGPQPVIELTPVEAEVAAEEVAQQAGGKAKSERATSRRRTASSRPRRARRSAGDGSADAGEGAPELASADTE